MSTKSDVLFSSLKSSPRGYFEKKKLDDIAVMFELKVCVFSFFCRVNSLLTSVEHLAMSSVY